MVLLRHSCDVGTVALYWVNRNREQFVLETRSTEYENTRFQDRVAFGDSFLQDYADIDEPIELTVGEHVSGEDLEHYYGEVPVGVVYLVPFINNRETVALTVLESSDHKLTPRNEQSVFAYTSALQNLLHTYLELNDLRGDEQQWEHYEQLLDSFSRRMDTMNLLSHTVEKLQVYLKTGGVSLVCRGMNQWHNVLNATSAAHALPLGLAMQEPSLAFQALQSGKPEFAIHFNANPRRMAANEPDCRGATLAIPVLLNDRRHALFLCYEENPLVFDEATRHKLVNMVRLASYKLMADNLHARVDEDLLANDYQAYVPELLEATLDNEIARLSRSEDYSIFAGMITPAGLSSLRTRFRMEQLGELQRTLIGKLNPVQWNMNGYLSMHSDYVYLFVVQCSGQQQVSDWLARVQDFFSSPVSLRDGSEVDIGFHTGFVQLTSDYRDASDVLKKAKAVLSEQMQSAGNMDN